MYNSNLQRFKGKNILGQGLESNASEGAIERYIRVPAVNA
jgi:hypothetical protein